MSPDPHPARDARPFAVALAVFVAWVIGLGVLAYTASEKPRAEPIADPAPRGS